MSTLLYTLGVFNTHTVITTMVMLASYESSQHCAGVMTFSTGFANGYCKCTNAVSSACNAQETTSPCLPSFPLPSLSFSQSLTSNQMDYQQKWSFKLNCHGNILLVKASLPGTKLIP